MIRADLLISKLMKCPHAAIDGILQFWPLAWNLHLVIVKKLFGHVNQTHTTPFILPFLRLTRVGFLDKSQRVKTINACYHKDSPLRKGDKGGCILF